MSVLADYAFEVSLTPQRRLRLGLKFGFVNYKNPLTEYILYPDNEYDRAFAEDIDLSFLPNVGVGAFLYEDNYYVGLSVPKIVQNEFKDNYHNEHFKVPYPTLNFGAINGGDSPNRICGCCDLHIDMRPVPGVSTAELFITLKAALAEVEKRYPNCVEVHHLHEPIPSYQCPMHSDLIENAQIYTGNQAQSVNYCTEAPFVQQLGCETIVLGPGSIAQAHQPNEYLDLSCVKPTKEVINKLITHYCVI